MPKKGIFVHFADMAKLSLPKVVISAHLFLKPATAGEVGRGGGFLQFQAEKFYR
jgi:hypothetical protein